MESTPVKITEEKKQAQRIAYKKYYDKNKDAINARGKIYKDNNKEKNKIYRENNKDAIKLRNEKYRAKTINCQCGMTISMAHKADHLKSPKHVNFIEKNESPLIKIHEYSNYFEINTKLPNGEQLRVKKRFNNIENNKDDVLNKMKEIREQNLIHFQ